MSLPLVVAILILESDVEAEEYFKGEGKHDFQTLAGGGPIYFVPETITDLFEDDEVRERYKDLKRSDLSCIWAEDPEKRHFIVPLRNLNADQLRNVLSDLGDAAEGAEDADAWGAAFKELQMKREKSQKPVKEPGSSQPPPGPNPGHNHDANGEKKQEKDDEDAKPEKPGGGKGDIDILRVFGKYGGLGGLGLGVLFLLFGKLTFPKLTAEQATPFMFLVFGATVLAIIVWAARSDKGRSLKFVLALVAIVIAVLAWLTLPRKSPEDVPYTVLVTVLNPDKQPVSDAHVSSNIGDTPLKSDDKWQIPVVSTAKGQTLTVYADVEDQGWKGSIDQLLGDNHSPSVNVPLKETGELPVRGTVKGADGRVVPNAFVSIAGYEAKVTNASGQFELTSHAAMGKTVHIHAEMPPNLVADLPAYEVGSAPAELTLRPSGANDKNRVQPVKPHGTGDAVIDGVLTHLYSLQHGGRPPTEAQLAEALAPLFSRPAFYNTRQQDWGHFLYPLCRTRLLLEQYEGEFKSSPAVRKNIGDAVKRMVQLQNDVASLYGPNFRIDEHIRAYISDSDKFIQNLPRLETTPSPEFYDARDRQIQEIRQSLQAAGLLESP